MSFKDKLKKVTSEIKSRYKYMRGNKGILESDYEKIKHWQPDDEFAKADKEHALAEIDLVWFLFCLTKFAAKDIKNGLNAMLLKNVVIDKWEENKKNIKTNKDDSEFKKFFKNLQKSHPRAAATLQLWMVYALMTLGVVGGVKIVQHRNLTKQVNVEKENKKTIDYIEFKESLQDVTPLLIVDLIAKEGVVLIDSVKEKEMYESVCRKKGLNPADKPRLHKPYKKGRDKWTIGFGSTVLKDGTRVNEHTQPITDEEAYELARWHIEDYETYPMLYWYYIYDRELEFQNVNEAIGMGSIFYNTANKLIEDPENENNQNRFEELRQYRDGKKGKICYGPNIPDSIILDCFARYPVTAPRSFGDVWLNHKPANQIANSLGGFFLEGGGIFWRRWLEAGLITGDVNPKDLLECPVNGVADFHKYMGGYKKNDTIRKKVLWEEIGGEWQPKKETYIAFKEWLKKPKTRDKKGIEGLVDRKKVKDFLPKDVLLRLEKEHYTDRLNYVKKSKTIAFNEGIMKIKNKQKDNMVIYPFDNEHRV